jgi:hypothetical protein
VGSPKLPDKKHQWTNVLERIKGLGLIAVPLVMGNREPRSAASR